MSVAPSSESLSHVLVSKFSNFGSLATLHAMQVALQLFVCMHSLWLSGCEAWEWNLHFWSIIANLSTCWLIRHKGEPTNRILGKGSDFIPTRWRGSFAIPTFLFIVAKYLRQLAGTSLTHSNHLVQLLCWEITTNKCLPPHGMGLRPSSILLWQCVLFGVYCSWCLYCHLLWFKLSTLHVVNLTFRRRSATHKPYLSMWLVSPKNCSIVGCLCVGKLFFVEHLENGNHEITKFQTEPSPEHCYPNK